jgi:hypothetical protein
MKVLSHRGYWKTPTEKNVTRAFSRSFSLGFGTETDLRDLDGRIVIAHDPPREGALSASEMFAIHRSHDPLLPLALNIKADGLQPLVSALLKEQDVPDAFVFDMSVPDAIRWLQTDVPVFTRHSDVEPEPHLYDEAAGIWLDAFGADWWDATVIRRHLDAGKRVCVVSPELHQREYIRVWEELASTDLVSHPDILICTDYPEEAREVFGNAD